MQKFEKSKNICDENNYVNKLPITLSTKDLNKNNLIDFKQKKQTNESNYNNVNDLHRLKFLTVHKCKHWNTNDDRLIGGKLFIEKNGITFKSSSFKIKLDYYKIVDIVKIKNYLNTYRNVLSINLKENDENDESSNKSYIFYNFRISKDIIRNLIILFKENTTLPNYEVKCKQSKLKRVMESIKYISKIVYQSSSAREEDSSINIKESTIIIGENKKNEDNNKGNNEIESNFMNQAKILIENDSIDLKQIDFIKIKLEPNVNSNNRNSMRLVKKMSSLNTKPYVTSIKEESQSDLQEDKINNQFSSINSISETEKTCKSSIIDGNERIKFKKNPNRAPSVFKKIFQSQPMVKLRSFSLNDNNFKTKINESKYLSKLISFDIDILRNEEQDLENSRKLSNSEAHLNQLNSIDEMPENNENFVIKRKRSTSLMVERDFNTSSEKIMVYSNSKQKHQSNRDSGFDSTDMGLDLNNEDVLIEEQFNNNEDKKNINEEIQMTNINSTISDENKSRFKLILQLFSYFYFKMGDPFILLAPFGLLLFAILILSGLSNLSTLCFIDERLNSFLQN
jgi:hypothetical protein